jgi:hypothetical protein
MKERSGWLLEPSRRLAFPIYEARALRGDVRGVPRIGWRETASFKLQINTDLD